MKWHMFHKYEVRAVNLMDQYRAINGVPVMSFPPTPITQVVSVCTICGKKQSQTMVGTWTVEQLANKD